MPEALILIHGDDPYLVQQEAAKVRSQLTQELVEEMGLEEFHASQDLESIGQSLSTPPFMAIRRVVLIWDPPQVPVSLRGTEDPETLCRLLEQRLETTAACVVFRRLLGPASAFIKACRALGADVRTLNRPRGRELQRHVERRVRARGLTLGPAVQARLLEAASTGLGKLESELDKLEIYAAGSRRITDPEGLGLVSADPTTELYRLTDAIFEQPAIAGERLAELRGRLDVPPQVVVGALARALRELISYSDPGESGWRNLPPWKQKHLTRQRALVGPQRLSRWLVELADLDWQSRTGKLDISDGLEVRVAAMAAELGRRRRTRAG